MINKEQWKPSKYVYRKNKLVASRNPKVVSRSSRLIADVTAALYETYLPVYAKGKLLDLGCGNVPLFGAYKNLVTEVTCVDWENSLHKNAYLDYECDLTQPLPFTDGEFDTIILSDVLEHIPQPENLWREMSRILATNGIVVMNTPFFYRLHEIPHDYYRYTEYALRRFAELVDFKILLLKPMGGTPEIFADLLAKRFKSICVPIQFIAGLFLQTTMGRRISEKTGRDYPLGYFLVAGKSN